MYAVDVDDILHWIVIIINYQFVLYSGKWSSEWMGELPDCIH